MYLVSRGYTNLNIGTRLGIKETTVKRHLEIVFRKFGFGNRTEASRAFIEGRLIGRLTWKEESPFNPKLLVTERKSKWGRIAPGPTFYYEFPMQR